MNAMKIGYKYWTKTPGIGGKIAEPEDFVVNEVISPKFTRKYERTKNGMKTVKGPYSLFILKKRCITTHDAIKRLAVLLKIREKEIGYAGLKDRFAVTCQYVTIKGGCEIKEKDMELSFINNTCKFIAPGDLVCNQFTITLHKCKNIERLDKIIRELKSRGMPNYFGMQRFGSRQNNHIIGKHLIRKEFSSAMTLIRQGNDYRKIEDVPKHMLKFFINAYQSWIFNERLNRYIEKNNKPLFRPAKIEAFRVPELRISCNGGARKLFISIREISFTVNKRDVNISFMLPRGSYATVLLREISKHDIRE